MLILQILLFKRYLKEKEIYPNETEQKIIEDMQDILYLFENLFQRFSKAANATTPAESTPMAPEAKIIEEKTAVELKNLIGLLIRKLTAAKLNKPSPIQTRLQNFFKSLTLTKSELQTISEFIAQIEKIITSTSEQATEFLYTLLLNEIQTGNELILTETPQTTILLKLHEDNIFTLGTATEFYRKNKIKFDTVILDGKSIVDILDDASKELGRDNIRMLMDAIFRISMQPNHILSLLEYAKFVLEWSKKLHKQGEMPSPTEGFNIFLSVIDSAPQNRADLLKTLKIEQPIVIPCDKTIFMPYQSRQQFRLSQHLANLEFAAAKLDLGMTLYKNKQLPLDVYGKIMNETARQIYIKQEAYRLLQEYASFDPLYKASLYQGRYRIDGSLSSSFDKNYNASNAMIKLSEDLACTYSSIDPKLLQEIVPKGMDLVKFKNRQTFVWSDNAAMCNVNHGMFHLADCYLNNVGIPEGVYQNLKTEAEKRSYRLSQAFNWFLKAAEIGHAISQGELARLYEKNLGVPDAIYASYSWATNEQNKLLARYYEAFKWCSLAVKNGAPLKYHYDLALLFRDAKFPPEEYNKVNLSMSESNKQEYRNQQFFQLCKTAAEQGEAGAQEALGEAYYFNRNLPLKELADKPSEAAKKTFRFEQGFKWLMLAAKNGQAEAATHVSYMYANDYAPPDELANFKTDAEKLTFRNRKAFYWAKIAAQQGNVRAMHNLSVFYGNVYCSEEDEYRKLQSDFERVSYRQQQEFYWAKKAAQLNFLHAFQYLAGCYELNKGVPETEYEQDSTEIIRKLYRDREAFKWCKKGADLKDMAARIKLANYYRNNIGVPETDYQAEIKSEAEQFIHRKKCAFELYKGCALEKNKEAQWVLIHYYEGNVNNIYDNALSAFEESAQKTAYSDQQLYRWTKTVFEENLDAYGIQKMAQLYLQNRGVPAEHRSPSLSWEKIRFYYRLAYEYFKNTYGDMHFDTLTVLGIANKIDGSPLCFVITNKRPDLLQMFLDQNSNINVVDDQGHTPLEIAVALQPPMPDMVDLLQIRDALEPCFKNYQEKIMNLFIKVKINFLRELITTFKNLSSKELLKPSTNQLNPLINDITKTAAERWHSTNLNAIVKYFVNQSIEPKTAQEFIKMLSTIIHFDLNKRADQKNTPYCESKDKKSVLRLETSLLLKDLKPYIRFLLDEAQWTKKRDELQRQERLRHEEMVRKQKQKEEQLKKRYQKSVSVAAITKTVTESFTLEADKSTGEQELIPMTIPKIVKARDPNTIPPSYEGRNIIRDIILGYLIKIPKSVKSRKKLFKKQDKGAEMLYPSFAAWQELCNLRYTLSKLIFDRYQQEENEKQQLAAAISARSDAILNALSMGLNLAPKTPVQTLRQSDKEDSTESEVIEADRKPARKQVDRIIKFS